MRKWTPAQPGATIAAIMISCAPLLASAHPGHGAGGGLSSGLLHPLTGWDHLIAILAIGLWCAERNQRAALITMGAFLGALAAGAIAADYGPSFEFVEPGMALSLVIFGALLIAGSQISHRVGSLLIAGFGALHGYAHGLGVSAMPGADLYIPGVLMMSTSGLLLADRCGRTLVERVSRAWLKSGGVLVALAGACLGATF